MYTKKLFIYLLCIFLFSACGTGTQSKPSDLKIFTTNDQNNTVTKEIVFDFRQQLGYIRKEFPDSEIKYYLSSDKQNVFILTHHGYDLTLYHYDFTQEIPVLVNIVKMGMSEKSTGVMCVHPLKNDKIIYVVENYGIDLEIYAYDIKNLKNIGYLQIEILQDIDIQQKLYNDPGVIAFDAAEHFMRIGDQIKVDIRDLYNMKIVD